MMYFDRATFVLQEKNTAICVPLAIYNLLMWKTNNKDKYTDIKLLDRISLNCKLMASGCYPGNVLKAISKYLKVKKKYDYLTIEEVDSALLGGNAFYIRVRKQGQRGESNHGHAFCIVGKKDGQYLAPNCNFNIAKGVRPRKLWLTREQLVHLLKRKYLKAIEVTKD